VTNKEATDLGIFIREARERSGMTLRSMEKQSGVTIATLSKIETGDIKVPTAESLQRIARSLELDYEDLALLAGYTLPKGLPNLPIYLRKKYDELSAEEIRQVEGYVRYLRQQHQDEGDHDGQPAR
jgi:transcriptional regulator with XRE-family HTH domain